MLLTPRVSVSHHSTDGLEKESYFVSKSKSEVVTLLDVLAIISAVGLLVAGVIRLGCHQCPGPYITYAKEQP